MNQLKSKLQETEGAITVPVIAWFLGVPGIVCLLAWLFFFRG